MTYKTDHSAQRFRSPLGFTLIELLVVISIIALLVGILLPALGAARRSAQTSQCLSNVRQIALASQLYAMDNNDYLPQFPPFGSPLPSWQCQGQQIYLLDPYISGDKIFSCPSAEATSSSGEAWKWWKPSFFGSPFESKYKPGTLDLAWGGTVRYTDFKLNDYKGPSNDIKDPADGVVDRPISQLPYTTWTVIAIDIDWGSTNEDGSVRDETIRRHGGGENLSFLDGHSEHLNRTEYHGYEFPDTAKKDPVGNNVWYRWGDPDFDPL